MQRIGRLSTLIALAGLSASAQAGPGANEGMVLGLGTHTVSEGVHLLRLDVWGGGSDLRQAVFSIVIE